MQLAELLFQFWETGENPYEITQQDDADNADSFSIRALAFQACNLAKAHKTRCYHLLCRISSRCYPMRRTRTN